MTSYNFEKLSNLEFEDFANALCAKYVARAIDVFGSGTDGGREATYRGRMTYPLDAPAAEQWDGYLVVQCKMKAKLSATLKLDADWAIARLDEEMDMYEKAVVPREKPEYFLFVTNVELSAKLKTGGKDRFLQRLDYWKKKLGMKGVGVWDRDKLGNLLTASQEIACRYGQLLPGDLIHAATKFFLANNTDINTAISLFLQNDLLEDQYISLKQAGQKTDETPALARVFVDLRAKGLNRNGQQVIVHTADAVQWASDRSVAPSRLVHEQRMAARESITSDKSAGQYEEDGSDAFIHVHNSAREKILAWESPSRFVFIGGPGQGKSTLVQYMSQRHRAALLKSGVFAIADSKAKDAIPVIAKEAEEAGCGLPKHPRLPFRIILEKFANDLANGEVASVMDYMVATIKRSSEQPFTRADAELVLKEMPLLVAFDGLDEVPAVSNRKELLRAIRRFLTEVVTKDADVLIVATTRPQGYTDEFDPSYYTHLSLAPLTQQEALTYAQKLVEAKYAGRKAMQRDILQRLKTAIGEKAIARLMESPLQVTIMAILVETLDKLPRERFVLFEEYYDIIYKREQGRGGKLSSVLHRFRSRIEVLHDRIGLRLQVEGETKAGTDGKTARQGRISKTEFRKVIHDILENDGHEGEELAHLAKQFEEVAIDRLVFIVQHQADSYGFEVRSLQEFAAARELMRVSEYATVRRRLLAISPIPYWRNTALFAIGQVFGRGDAYCAMIGQLYLDLNNDDKDTILSQTLAGSRLALDVIEEGIGEDRPVYYRGFLDQALHLLTLPYLEIAERLAALYETVHEERFRKATLAALGVGGGRLQLGPMALLINVVAHHPRAEWAQLLLQERWPAILEDVRELLEQLVEKFTWFPWQVAMVERVARASSIEWVRAHLSGRVQGKIKWVDAASKTIRHRGEAMFYAVPLTETESEQEVEVDEPEKFRFSFTSSDYSVDALTCIAEGQAQYMDWMPFSVCQPFLLRPSSTTLADAVEALVNLPAYVHKEIYFYGLPWQLHLIINDTSSKEEALAIAQRARDGELGNTQDWEAAEARWIENGCSPVDFRVFSDGNWPFTAEIALRGIQPFSSYSTTYATTPNDSTGRGLLEAFTTTTCRRIRPALASAFLFSRECTRNRAAAFAVPMSVVLDLVNNTTWTVEGPAALTLLASDLNWLSSIDELDAFGERITLERQATHRENRLLIEEDFSTYLANLKLLLKVKPLRGGILRLLASLLSMNAQRLEKVKLPAEDATLSLQGRVALTALHILSKSTSVPVEELKQKVANLWTVAGPTGRKAEMPDIISALISREQLLKHNAELLSQLLELSILPIELKSRIVSSLINQTQYRESGFGSEKYKEELHIAA